ncbi:hypothetical protein FNF27_06837 [Cafeteria roenbergensis]|uniref:G-protein alpha subunit n=1 Tax=Cafeteria roenbergensis TaxID=33653 RepID=A0A5A8DWE1_CAFRO|nr:hypothetical protein FNF27_06837 [Cafeteria roenbergensis]
MGSACCKPKEPELTGLDAELEAQREAAARKKRILILGTGESGKSSLVKQVKQIFGAGLSPSEIRQIAVVLRENVETCCVSLVNAVRDLGIDTSAEPKTAALLSEFAAASEAGEVSPEWRLSEATLPRYTEIWHSSSVQAAWERRSEFWVLDAARYYFENASRFVDPAFVPNEDDVVMARVITTGIAETSYRDSGVDITLVDVGGQRSERRKWIRCFEGVDAVAFLCALPEYDQVLYEDASTNRMRESLSLFAEVVANPAFARTPFFLLLNKKDLFETMIATRDLAATFPEYRGGKDASQAVGFITKLFEERFREAAPATGSLSCHVLSSRVRVDVRDTMKARPHPGV